MLEKYSVSYTSFDWRKELNTSLYRIQAKIDPEHLMTLETICSRDLLKERKTDSILSFGYHRI